MPWFQQSKSRGTRRWNSGEEREVKRLNAKLLKENSATLWELKEVGSMVIRRKIPNPQYKAPSIPKKTVAGHPTGNPNHRPPGPLRRQRDPEPEVEEEAGQ